MRTTQLPKWVLHTVLISGFLVVPYLFTSPAFLRIPHIFSRPHEAALLGGSVLAVLYLYVNYYVLLHRLALKGHFLMYGLITAGWVGAALLAPLLADVLVDPSHHLLHPPGPGPKLRPRPPSALIIKHNAIFFALAYLFSMFWHVHKQRLILAKEKAETEAAMLRTRLNPHFMFNSLNCIYSLAITEKANRAADAALMLSDMMRFMLNEASADKTELENELKYLSDFVNFQRLRLPEKTEVSLLLDPCPEGLFIAPLILLPIVENAFKHGVNTEKSTTIYLEVTFSGSTIKLRTVNSWHATGPADKTKSGYGAHITKGRLAHHYSNRHRFTVSETPQTYEVSLIIDLK